MQSLESAEQFIRIGHVKPRAIVTHEIGGFTVTRDNTKLDF